MYICIYNDVHTQAYAHTRGEWKPVVLGSSRRKKVGRSGRPEAARRRVAGSMNSSTRRDEGGPGFVGSRYDACFGL